ncbi:MAG: DOMON-like domain-containing protein [Rhodocyclaceae bacterium]|jgi:hypothetical protein|nr:DOMON-like domain-containing protein [Rhodocyclaceae bacterium]
MARAVHVVLAAHPANPSCFRQHVDVSVRQADDGGLVLTYGIHGPNLGLNVPTRHAPAPADALWRTTCCELFVATAGAPAYREFNFSPSGQWAACDFSQYRQRSAAAMVLPPPAIDCQRTDDHLRLVVTLPRSALPAGGEPVLALAVILQTQDGHSGYWALAHPPGRPDFHHPAGFVLHSGQDGLRSMPAIIPPVAGLQ